jgi:hypothetical protein
MPPRGPEAPEGGGGRHVGHGPPRPCPGPGARRPRRSGAAPPGSPAPAPTAAPGGPPHLHPPPGDAPPGAKGLERRLQSERGTGRAARSPTDAPAHAGKPAAPVTMPPPQGPWEPPQDARPRERRKAGPAAQAPFRQPSRGHPSRRGPLATKHQILGLGVPHPSFFRLSQRHR